MATAKKTPEKAGPKISKGAHVPVFRASAERLAAGQLLRNRVPRSSHADWKPPTNRRDPIDILEASNQGRLPELVPIRYGRMLRSPFTFLRGSAPLMAYDLAATPTTGIRVQACGDCHLLNFGLFATPERHLVFELRLRRLWALPGGDSAADSGRRADQTPYRRSRGAFQALEARARTPVPGVYAHDPV